MSQTTPTEPLTAELGMLLAEFSRTCKAAARAVSLYPGTHPAIASSLARLVSASSRLTNHGRVICRIRPDTITIGDRAPVKPDAAVVELASLLHDRLIGELAIDHDADAEDWRALLLLLARAPDDLHGAGGITQAWQQTGRSHFGIREIDYAEVLRERAGVHRGEWDRIVAVCLEGDRGVMDGAAVAALLEALEDSDTFGDLLDHFEQSQETSGVPVDARAAAVLRLMRSALEAVAHASPDDTERAKQTMADACARLTTETMLGLLDSARGPDAAEARLASAIVDRLNEHGVASFVARSVTTERGATEALSKAFDALEPQTETKARVLELAHDEARKTAVGQEPGFEDMWTEAANLLASGTNRMQVPDDYGRELTDAGSQALEVERVSDDPPERVHAWVDSVSETALQQLDFQLLRDLLRIELDPDAWEPLAMIAVGDIERRVLQGDIAAARSLAESLVDLTGSTARPPLHQVSKRVLDRLWSGPLVRHVATLFREEHAAVDDLRDLCHAVGASLARPLAERLAVEDDPRASSRLRDVLLSFGAAGRQSVEPLIHSANPAVRRTAIDLLRGFGGQEALTELASMLDDTDPQVQRESIRAIVQIGTNNAYAVLQRAIVAGSGSRDTILRELIALRDDKAAPLLCYVLRQTEPSGTLYRVHSDMIDAIGHLKAHSESVRTLRHVLYRGRWWSPFKTSALRRRAAQALRRMGSPDAIAVLRDAGASGRRGPRKAARAELAHIPRAEPNAR